MRNRRVLHSFTIIFIVLGMMYFYMISDFNLALWHTSETYYAFAKAVDLLLIACVLFPAKEFFKAWICVGSFFLVRELWEVLAVNDYASASRPSIIFLLFLSDTLCLTVIMIMQIKRR